MERRKFRAILPRLTELENINRVRAKNHDLRSQVEWLSDILHVRDELDQELRNSRQAAVVLVWPVDPTLSGSTIPGARGALAGGLNLSKGDSDDEFEPSAQENVDEREADVSEVTEIGMCLGILSALSIPAKISTNIKHQYAR